MNSFIFSISKQITQKKTHICVGLDSDYKKLPLCIKRNNSVTEAIFQFNREIVEATQDLVVAYKPNLVFYTAYGIDGFKALKKTNQYIKKKYPQIKIIAECKRNELGFVSDLAKKELFKELYCDALNITPWFGFDSILPYQKEKNKALFVICHDSNPSAIDLQDLRLKNSQFLWEFVADKIINEWNTSGNIFIEMALTYPKIMKEIQKKALGKKQFFLIVGLGSQGGDINDLKVFKEERNFIVSASRSIIFASKKKNFVDAAFLKTNSYKLEINRLFI